MTILLDTLVSPEAYNALPLVSEVAAAPDAQSQHLEHLRELLHKHKVPKGVSVRLLHKHFNTNDGEVMIPWCPRGAAQPRGIHFFVADDATLQAYFLSEFCRVVIERGLQRTFGLKLLCEEEEEHTGWTEFELNSERGTVMFPRGMPMPTGESDFTVTTEWEGTAKDAATPSKHSSACSHTRVCTHCNGHQSKVVHEFGEEYCLGGQSIQPGTALHAIVDQIVAAF
ncbi:uncharacterized protein BBA_05728 [Beauveria bassiana ARSEF 2860]|uniref:Uncharacterized protein n=1 Tax=Beauveria bassiana (strain ARSEF 2860) TaxID=655819 RepID=J4ULI1_BEAB2|nr:uncharacterized protein BBA_05728 [Beauveria bassiana ARSEF 2860]EJP65397.1 hypothetical protein BBA_05728 [Beauveria bassiana ARSEF 2860]